MGLENSNRQYVGIKEGKFVTKKDGAVQTFDSLRGVLSDVFVKIDGMYGPELLVTLRDKGEDYCVQMLMRSGYAKAFMSVAPSIDMAVELVLVPTAKTNHTKERIDYSMYINQHGKAIKWYYTRDKPNGLPDAVPCKIKDDKTGAMKDSWDFSAQQSFFTQKMYELRQLLPNRKLQESRENTATAQGSTSDVVDDLPF